MERRKKRKRQGGGGRRGISLLPVNNVHSVSLLPGSPLACVPTGLRLSHVRPSAHKKEAKPYSNAIHIRTYVISMLNYHVNN